MNEIPDFQSKTDSELVQLTLKHREFFGVLIKRYEKRLLRYILRISGCRKEEAEDILQEAFIKAYEHLNDFDQRQKFSSWIYRITHNEVISNYRKLQARAEGHVEVMDEHLFQTLASELDVKAEMEMKDKRTAIFNVLKTMDVKYREVLILKYLEEKDYKEISFILKKPMGTIATLLNRAKKHFRQKAEEAGIELSML